MFVSFVFSACRSWGIVFMYEFNFVFEYCLVSVSNSMFPSSFAQWNETIYVDTLNSSVGDVLEHVYQYVRSYHTAYSRIRGVIYAPLSAIGGNWVKGSALKYRWLATRPSVYTALDASNGKMYSSASSNPNNLVLPLSNALRLRLILSPSISGRHMYKYIRNIPFQYHQDLRYSQVRTHLPYFALDTDTLSKYNTYHKSALTNPAVLNNPDYHIIALGNRRSTLWYSRVIGYEAPHLTTTSRSFIFERYV